MLVDLYEHINNTGVEKIYNPNLYRNEMIASLVFEVYNPNCYEYGGNGHNIDVKLFLIFYND